MIDVKIDTSDWDDFYNAFKNQWSQQATAETRQFLIDDIQGHFQEKSFWGQKWEDHTDDYKIWMKRTRSKINPMLNQTGSLMRAMKRPDNKSKKSGDVRFVFRGKNKSAKYAHIHNNFPDGFWVKYPYGNTKIGGRRIAPRKFGWVSQKATDNIINVWSKIR